MVEILITNIEMYLLNIRMRIMNSEMYLTNMVDIYFLLFAPNENNV